MLIANLVVLVLLKEYLPQEGAEWRDTGTRPELHTIHQDLSRFSSPRFIKQYHTAMF
jgi:hypothetical protein